MMVMFQVEICLSSPIQNTKMKARVYVIIVDCYYNLMVIWNYNTQSMASHPYSSYILTISSDCSMD
jgi:hypothetical protein